MQCLLCDKPAVKRSWCNAHYRRWLRHGDPDAGGRLRRPRGLSAEETFRWFMPGDPPVEGCWDWSASTTQFGYGQFSMTTDKLRLLTAHRVAYEVFVGPIPDGMDILHSCDRPICCQPAHLRPGTAKENIQDARERGRMAQGEKNGHARLSTNDVLMIRSSGAINRELAASFNVDPSVISRIRNRKRWAHL